MTNPPALFIDTNALIRLLEGDELVIALLSDQVVYASVITEMEMQCKPNQSAEEADQKSIDRLHYYRINPTD